ncbi:Trm112 family protein [Trujillonella endophytica]|uniref:UPF0434 protein SAMN05660991_01411 n=1 Tax=Trujillonella endophytica TaxID=673521 RepID=A0A1H8RXT4_9ACTN|nr:Trm112 family protein [Trujillella endophytica]SEO71185.1 hypothetical protein SAMN05660991_01411 [Trujillella endophytica]
MTETSTGSTSGPLGLDPALLEILACPDTHHSPLTADEAASELLCTTCDRAFPVRDGIPVLLLDEARHRDADELARQRGTTGA